MKENGFIRKLRLVLKVMMSQAAQQTTEIHILLNIWQGKLNQTMKFGQLIEYNMNNIFLVNHTKNVLERPVPDILWEIKIEHIFASTVWIVMNLFLLYVQVEVHENVFRIRCWPLDFQPDNDVWAVNRI